jgi:hypothetical protein
MKFRHGMTAFHGVAGAVTALERTAAARPDPQRCGRRMGRVAGAGERAQHPSAGQVTKIGLSFARCVDPPRSAARSDVARNRGDQLFT